MRNPSSHSSSGHIGSHFCDVARHYCWYWFNIARPVYVSLSLFVCLLSLCVSWYGTIFNLTQNQFFFRLEFSWNFEISDSRFWYNNLKFWLLDIQKHFIFSGKNINKLINKYIRSYVFCYDDNFLSTYHRKSKKRWYGDPCCWSGCSQNLSHMCQRGGKLERWGLQCLTSAGIKTPTAG